MQNNIVKFGVGGKKYEVSKSQLDLHPNTMLARSTSKQWREDPGSEIFIDRDGSIFKYVLNYLRDGKVDLPLTVSKSALMKELIYYGFEDVSDEYIDDGKTQGVLAIRAYNDSALMLKKISKEAYKEGVYGDCAHIAGVLIDRYMKDASHEKTYICSIIKSTEGELYERMKRISHFSRTDSRILLQKFNHYHNRAGLDMPKMPVCSITERYNFTLKTINP